MQISFGGIDIRGGIWSDVATVTVDSVAVSSATFSGLDQTAHDVYACNFTWYVDGLGAAVLLGLPDGAAVPTGSTGVLETSVAAARVLTNADDMGFCRLSGAAPGVVATGTLYFMGRSRDNIVRTMISEWFGDDATIVLGDRLVLSIFRGIWNEVVNDYLSTMTISVQGGGARIGLNSIFRLVKA